MRRLPILGAISLVWIGAIAFGIVTDADRYTARSVILAAIVVSTFLVVVPRSSGSSGRRGTLLFVVTVLVSCVVGYLAFS